MNGPMRISAALTWPTAASPAMTPSMVIRQLAGAADAEVLSGVPGGQRALGH